MSYRLFPSIIAALRGIRPQLGSCAVFLLAACLTFNVADVEAKSKKSKEQRAETEEIQETAAPPDETVPTKKLPSGLRHISIPLKKLGAQGPVGLRGVQGSFTLPFSIRSDEVVLAAKLKMKYNYSPSLLPELSHLQVLMNDEVSAVIPLPKDKYLGNSREIDIDSRFFTDYNKLMFRLIGHYTYRCEDPLHTSLWANIGNQSTLELTLAPLSLVNDLRILPVPFFDRRDDNRLNLPFVFAGKPSMGTLKAAGVVASWFGSIAGYRGAKFPTQLSSLPPGNAVVFLAAGEAIQGMSQQGASGPTLAIEPHPTNPAAKLLIISGRTDEEMMQAVHALTLDDNGLSGQRVTLTKVSEPPQRKPYDAPTWIATDRPVRFAELAKMEDLNVRGYFPSLIKLNFRVSPDLFTWRSAGVPMELKYRYTNLAFNKNSSLNISINQNFVHALALGDGKTVMDKNVQIRDKLKLPVLDNDLAIRDDVLFVPPYQVGARNQLQLQYFFEITKEGECRDVLPDNLAGAVDPDSSIDFSSFPHYAAMPNLAFFANIGFPFTRYADLSETAVVLPDAPTAHEISAYFGIMGRMGESTGYPSFKHALITPGDVEKMADRDILIIGSTKNQPLFSRWADRLPLVDTNGERRLRTPMLKNLLYRWEEKDLQQISRPDGIVNFSGGGSMASLMAFESPLRSKRSVVALFSDQDIELEKITNALIDQEDVAAIHGDFVVFNDPDPVHYRVADTYFVGSLPIWTHVRWITSQHPIVTGVLALIAALLISALSFRFLRLLAAKRLPKNG